MKYMIMIYNRPDFVAELSDDERNELFADVDRIMGELSASGEWVGGQGLAGAASARTVRGQDGQAVITDGPYMEAKEQFAGYLAVDCETLERAVEIAASWPDVRYGGAMEVRAIMGGDEPEI